MYEPKKFLGFLNKPWSRKQPAHRQRHSLFMSVCAGGLLHVLAQAGLCVPFTQLTASKYHRHLLVCNLSVAFALNLSRAKTAIAVRRFFHAS